ncbi:hypothetical protein QE152_g3965 [Popillia japonica]|uniref:Mutator-like transposase domain-containing protein n=1 Tax=Popillia japonica TaxID=7064 RepID=A0AAW1MYN3_POPJA
MDAGRYKRACIIENCTTDVLEGIIAAGAGYSCLEEVMTALDIPCISSKTFIEHQGKVYEAFYATCSMEMEKAGKEELRLAKEAGDVDERGRGVRFRTAITKAIAYRSRESKSKEEKIAELKNDILNGHKHIFGELPIEAEKVKVKKKKLPN